MNNFFLELTETRGGLEKLSCQIDGKHYVGFFSTKERTGPNGEAWTYKLASMRICSWERCKICHPVEEEQELELF